MSERAPRDRTPGPRRLLAVAPALSLTLALTTSGCSPGPAPSPVDGGTTSKVPEIAQRQKHMADMLKKGASKAESTAKPH